MFGHDAYPTATPDFAGQVRRSVSAIPSGQVRTYKQIAVAAGRPRAWRAVGNILNRNHDPDVPCHRVVRSDGRPGGYNRGRRLKIELLEREGALSRRSGLAVRRDRPI